MEKINQLNELDTSQGKSCIVIEMSIKFNARKSLIQFEYSRVSFWMGQSASYECCPVQRWVGMSWAHSLAYSCFGSPAHWVPFRASYLEMGNMRGRDKGSLHGDCKWQFPALLQGMYKTPSSDKKKIQQ